MVLMVMMVITLVPNVGGTGKAYAEEEGLSGYVLASSLKDLGNYILTGDTTIDVDTDKIIASINIGSFSLQIAGDSESILSVWGSGITGGQGKLILTSGGKLEADSSTPEGITYPAAIDITNGTVQFDGGELFINYSCSSPNASTACGISCANFIMNSGKATITCTANSESSAVGIECDVFEMHGGDVGVSGIANHENKVGYGISTRGTESYADFYISGGSLNAEGHSEGTEGYGIDWFATRDNTFIVEGGTLETRGESTGIRSRCNVLFNAGAQVKVTANGGIGVDIEGGSLTVQGVGTRFTANTGTGTAVAVYNNDINIIGGAIMIPENGETKDVGSLKTIVDATENVASNVEIECLPIPTEIAITYDVSKAFPTTRLSGRDVSMYLLKSITSNPGRDNANDGWYVCEANPNKTDTSTNKWTCLVKKEGDSYEPLDKSDEKLNAEDEYYFQFNLELDGTRAYDMSKTYSATVNGVPADYITQPTASDDVYVYIYKRVYFDETTDLIWSVYVTPQDANVAKGGSRQYTAETVGATNDAVIWSVSDNDSTGTYIDSSGKLFVAEDETAGRIRVTATSVIDNTVYDTTNVNVLDEEPYIGSVTVTADNDTVYRGNNVQFNAVVEGTDLHDLTWELIGSDGSSYFDGGSNTSRYLVVKEEETASQLTVRATSVADPTKYGEATITLKDKEVITGPINITYDTSAVKLTESKTGKQVTEEFRTAITSPKGTDFTVGEAPDGWYVFCEDGRRWTSLVRGDGYGGFDHEALYNSEELLSDSEEYYLWFNLDDMSETHRFDSSMDINDLKIMVNGEPVDGKNIIAEWGQPLEVYMRVYLEGHEPVDIGSGGSIAVIPDQTYTGSAIEPDVTVTFGEKTLVKDTDYTVDYSNNIVPGTATVTVTGIGKYTGTIAGTFNIVMPDAPENAVTSINITIDMDALAAFDTSHYAKDIKDRLNGENAAINVDSERVYSSLEGNDLAYRQDSGWNHCSGGDKLDASTYYSIYIDVIALEEGYVFVDTVKLADFTLSSEIPGFTTMVNGVERGDVFLHYNPGYSEYGPVLAAYVPIGKPSDVTRIFGKSRYETAIKSADAYKEQLGVDKFDNVIVACGTNYADALAGSYLSTVKKAPILLVRNKTDELNLVTGYIKANLKPGGMIYILGGTAVVPDTVKDDLEGFNGYKVRRLYGKDRYATNVKILEEAGLSGDEIIVASGTGFADSLSASALGKPVLLVKGTIQPSQEEYIKTLTGKTFCLIGGKGAVSEGIETELKKIGTTERISGKNRYETSAAVAERFFAEPKGAVLAYGEDYPDGLCGGTLANAIGGPLLLSRTGRADQAAAYAVKKGINLGFVLGGPTLISDDDVRKIFNMPPGVVIK